MIDKHTITNAAQKFAARGQIDEAIAEWEKLLSVNQDGNVYNTIGDLYLKQREQQKAVESFEKAANIFREDGFYPKAIALFKKILNIVPDEVSALIALAQLNAERGFTNQAVDEMQKVAEIFIKRNNFQKAIEVYERVLRLVPLDTNIKIKVAELAKLAGMTSKACQGFGVVAADHMEKGEFDQAEAYYKKALELDPKFSSALLGLSNLSDRTGNAEQALQYLNQAISVNPEDQATLLRYARLSIKAEKIDEAKQTLMKMIEKDASNLDAKKLLGLIYSDEGMIEEAWGELQPCIDEVIGDKDWADALAMLNNFDEVNSIPVRKRFVDIYRGNGDNGSLLVQLFELGVLYENKGSNAEALALYQEAVEIEADNAEINEKVSQLENSVNDGADEHAADTEAGKKEGHAEEEISIQYHDAKKTEADFYVQQGLNEEAAKIYQELIEANPDDEDILTAMNNLKSADGSIVSSSDTQESPVSAHADINSAMNEILQEAGVDDETSADIDYDSHFQKGIDLHRQGQLNEAIIELQKASADPGHVVRNSRMLAMCYVEQDNYVNAIGQFERAFNELSSDDDGFLDIQYDLAEAYMKNGENEKAQIRYSEIHQYDPTFRDVVHKLEPQEAGTVQVDEVPVMDSGRTAVKTKQTKSRISYI